MFNPDSPHAANACSLLAAMSRARDGHDVVLTEREREVLRYLPSQRDKEIAGELGISVNGVRYHLRKLFGKLGVARRADAVRRARDLGLLGEDS